VAYSRYQIQIVRDDEVKPTTRDGAEQYATEIVSKRKVKGLMYYKVKFEDGDIIEWDAKQVKEVIPDLLEEFNKKKI
jgi:hypothetical protein